MPTLSYTLARSIIAFVSLLCRISGMSAFRKNVPGRKLSISKPNANSISPKMDEDGNIIEEANNNNNNNDTDSKNINNYNNLIRGGGDGTLTISELPEQIKAE